MSGFSLHTALYIYYILWYGISVAYAATVTGSGFIRRFRLFVGQCILIIEAVEGMLYTSHSSKSCTAQIPSSDSHKLMIFQ